MNTHKADTFIQDNHSTDICAKFSIIVAAFTVAAAPVFASDSNDALR